MGADGGFTWAEVKFGTIAEAKLLLEPFGIFDSWHGRSDIAEEAETKWMDENWKSLPEQCVMAPYGTDCDSGGLKDIGDIEECFLWYMNELHLETIADVMLDCDTAPEWETQQYDVFIKPIKCLVRKRNNGILQALAPKFVEMRLQTWIDEVKKRVGPVHSVETWT